MHLGGCVVCQLGILRCHTGIFGIMLHMKDYATCTIGHVRCRKCCAQDNVQGGVVEVTIQQETTPPRSKAQQWALTVFVGDPGTSLSESTRPIRSWSELVATWAALTCVECEKQPTVLARQVVSDVPRVLVRSQTLEKPSFVTVIARRALRLAIEKLVCTRITALAVPLIRPRKIVLSFWLKNLLF